MRLLITTAAVLASAACAAVGQQSLSQEAPTAEAVAPLAGVGPEARAIAERGRDYRVTEVLINNVPDLAASGVGFIMELSGNLLNRGWAALNGTRLHKDLGNGQSVDVLLERVAADAMNPCGPTPRITAFMMVQTQSGGVVVDSSATVIMMTALDVVHGTGNALTVEIHALPETALITDDSCNAPEIERLIAAAAPEIAEKLSMDVGLDGLEDLEAARALGSPPLRADAYQIGFAWVLRVYSPDSPAAVPPQSVFVQGNAFTLALSAPMAQNLASYQLSRRAFPAKLTANGLVDPNGSIDIDSATINLEQDQVIATWRGVAADGVPVVVRWTMQFVSTVDGLSLHITEILVNGKRQDLPQAQALVNPVDELLKLIATGPNKRSIFTSPLGRMRLVTGRITPGAIVVAGRAW